MKSLCVGLTFLLVIAPVSATPATHRAAGFAAERRDDQLGAVRAWRLVFAQAPAENATRALWSRFVELCEETGQLPLLEGAARDLMSAKGTSPDMRAAAQLVLARAARWAGDSAQAQKLESGLGFVRAWRAIGPFDNVSRSGFEKQFAPEREVNFAKEYRGKDDKAVRWRTVSLTGRDGACLVGRQLGENGTEVFYAASALNSPKAQDATLNFTPLGAGKIWLNGELLFSDEIYRRFTPMVGDVFRLPVKLKAGWNPLLVKVASEWGEAAFALRFTTSTGSGLTLDAQPAKYPNGAVRPAASNDSPRAQPALLAALQTRFEGGEPEKTATIAYLQQLFNEPDIAAQTLSNYLAAHPKSPAWLYWQQAQALSDDGQADESRLARQRALALDSKLLPARLAVISDDDGLSASQRVQKLKALAPANPQSSELAWALAQAYSTAELESDAVAAARRAMRLAPGADSIASLISWLDDSQLKSESESVLAAGLKSFPGETELWRTKAQRLTTQGKISESLAAYRTWLGLDVPNPKILKQMAEVQKGQRDLKGAIATLTTVRALRPQDADITALLADLLRERGDKSAALALYRTAVALNPATVSLREKVRLLSGEKSPFDLAPALPFKPAPKTGAKETASVVLLLDEARQVVYPDGATVTRFHEVAAINDAAGVETYQEYEMQASTASSTVVVEQAKIISANGKVRDVADEFSSSSNTISLPSLAPGDVFDVSYRIEDYQQGGLARQFWTQWFFSAIGRPIKVTRFVLITPAATQYTLRGHGAVPEVKTREANLGGANWRVCEWRMDNVPARKPEPMMSASPDGNIWLDVSSIASWRQIVDWYRDLSTPRCVPDATIRAKAALLTKDAKTEEEKLRAIYAYVAHDLQYQTTPFRLSWYVPTEGKQVIREKYADCKDKAALLTALCAAVGIKSRMALVSGRSAGLTPHLPSPRFNHAIAVVETASGPLWIDATADQMSFGDLPFDDQGVEALIIGDGISELTTTPLLPPEKSQAVELHRLELSTEGTLKGSYLLSASGSWGWMLRSAMRRVPANRHEEVFSNMSARMVENSRASGGQLLNLDEPEKPVEMKFSYVVEKFGTKAGGLHLVRLPWETTTSKISIRFGAPPRTQDLEMSQLRGLTQSTLILKLPPGYAPLDIPAEVKDESKFGHYRFTYKVEGNVAQGATLMAKQESLLSTMRIAAAEAPDFLEYIKKMEEEASRQIVLKK